MRSRGRRGPGAHGGSCDPVPPAGGPRPLYQGTPHTRRWEIMSLAGLLAAVAEDSQLRTALASADTPGAGERDLVAPSALRPLLVAALAAGTVSPDGLGRFVLAVTATAREAEDLTAALGAFLPPHSVATFPGWETLPHERLSPRSDTVGQRIAVLRRLAHPGAASGLPVDFAGGSARGDGGREPSIRGVAGGSSP